MKTSPFNIAAILALVLALGLAARIHSQSQGFRRVVNHSLATSEGYDQKFIDLVNQLEDILTTRAQFSYPGGRDPMTGRRREVAASVLAPVTAHRTAHSGKTPTTKAPKVDSGMAKLEALDRVRLTAIIADDYGQHTAIVMDGERSVSVDVGDSVGLRRVVRITGKELTMEDDTTIYTYGLSGTRALQNK